MSLTQKRRPTAYHKKISAGHHRQGKHYLKAYWPYLPMLMTIGIGLITNSLWSSNQQVLGASSDFTNSSLLQYTNNYRIKSQELALTIDARLTAAAQSKADDMVINDYWAHTSPDGKTPWSFISANAYNYQSAGENLAYGFTNASDTITGWMNSSSHRANVLSTSYTNVGFGVASSPNYQGKGPEVIIVAEYAQPAGFVAGASNTAPTIKELTGTQVSRIQLLTGGQATWSALVLSLLTGAALAVFIVRHWIRFHKIVRKGEVFLARHAYVDIVITLVLVVGFVLTRSSGITR